MSPTDQQLDALAQLLSKAPSLQSAYTTLQLKSWLQSFFEERDVLASLTPTEVVVPAGVNNLGSNRALRVRMSNDTRFILISEHIHREIFECILTNATAFYENRSTNPSGQQMEDLLQIINTIEPSYTIKKMKVWFSKRRAAEKKKELEAIAAEYADFKEKDNRAMWQQTISSGSADSATVMPTAAIESLKTLLREDKDPSPTFASLTKWASELGVNVVAIVLWLNNNPPPYGAIEPEASIQADASSQSIHLPTPEGTTSPELEERQSLPPLSPLENPIISSIPRHNGDDESKYFQGNSRQEKTMRPPRVKGLRFAPTSEPPTIPPIFDQTAKARIQEAFQAGVTDYPEPPRSLQEFEARFEELDVLMEEILGSD